MQGLESYSHTLVWQTRRGTGRQPWRGHPEQAQLVAAGPASTVLRFALSRGNTGIQPKWLNPFYSHGPHLRDGTSVGTQKAEKQTRGLDSTFGALGKVQQTTVCGVNAKEQPCCVPVTSQHSKKNDISSSRSQLCSVK